MIGERERANLVVRRAQFFRYNWRAGASQPSGANGAIFPLYIILYIYIYISGAAYVVSNSTLHAHAHAHVKLQSAA